MKLKFLKFMLLTAMGLVLPAVLSGCKDKEVVDPAAGGGSFVIEQQYLNYSIGRDAKSINVPVTTSLPNSQWYLNFDPTMMMATKTGPVNGVGNISINVYENTTGQIRTGVVTVSTSTTDYSISIRQYPDNTLRVEPDFQIKPVSAFATNEQPGSGIELSFDDDVKTMFHSRWSPTGPFPFELRYNFAGQEEIDYFEYTPREGGGNGAFKELEVYVATDAARSNFEKIGEYDFNGSAVPRTVGLPAGIKPTSIKFMVKSGVGDFVSCAEMRFYRKNEDTELNRQLLNVFTDLTCSELKQGITADDLAELDPAFQRIGDALLNNSYGELEKSFRIHEYEAYSDPTQWYEKLMTKIYSNWDNPMGIAVKKGEPVLILVGETYGNNLQVQIVGEQGSVAEGTQRPQSQGSFQPLKQGVNQITPDQDGQLFLMYTAVPSAPTSKPIKVHVPLGNGTLAGYFDLNEHRTDEKFQEIIRNTSGDYFCVRGDRMILYFRRSLLPSRIVDPITQWDNIITWQQNFMGIDDVRPALWNNHIAGITMGPECGYMWASNWCMGFVEYKVQDIMGLARLNANADNAWGPAHEMGHINQAAINWASTTESSNNLFSNYVIYRFGKYNSRGKGLYYRFGAVYEKNHSWASMKYEGTHTGPSIPSVVTNGEQGYFDEDPEIHMRMNWQLWNYYHRVLGDEKYFGRVFKIMRDLGLNETDDPGRKQLEFAVACSQAAGEDLTDFFEAWGFFKAHSSTVGQYGDWSYRVTLDQINEAKSRMSQFPKPKHALEYIEDRIAANQVDGDPTFDQIGDMGHYETYRQNLKVASNAAATVTGRSVSTSNCSNAVAIEIRERSGNDYGAIRFASNFASFTIPASVETSGCGVYAVQADGTRILLATL